MNIYRKNKIALCVIAAMIPALSQAEITIINSEKTDNNMNIIDGLRVTPTGVFTGSNGAITRPSDEPTISNEQGSIILREFTINSQQIGVESNNGSLVFNEGKINVTGTNNSVAATNITGSTVTFDNVDITSSHDGLKLYSGSNTTFNKSTITSGKKGTAINLDGTEKMKAQFTGDDVQIKGHYGVMNEHADLTLTNFKIDSTHWALFGLSGSIALSDGEITHTGDANSAIMVKSAALQNAVVNDVSITSAKRGVQAAEGAHITLNNSNIDSGTDNKTQGQGIFAENSGSVINYNNGTIKVHSMQNTGVDAVFARTSSVINLNNTTIEMSNRNKGAALHAIQAGIINAEKSHITTHANDVSAIQAGSVTTIAEVSSKINILDSKVITHGRNSHGMLLEYGGEGTLSNSTIDVKNKNSAGIYAIREGNVSQVTKLDNSHITAKGDGISVNKVTLNATLKNKTRIESENNALNLIGYDGKALLNIAIESGSHIEGKNHLVFAEGEAIVNLKADASTLKGVVAPTYFTTFVNFDLKNNSTWEIDKTESYISNLSNHQSVVRFSAPTAAPNRAMNVTGLLNGNEGVIELWTSLGDDHSATDKVILMGPNAKAEAGNALRIKNYNKSQGAQTDIGIMVVEAQDDAKTSIDAFILDPESDGYRKGHNSLVAGAYDYSLVRSGNQNKGEEHNWYLVSEEYIEDDTNTQVPPLNPQPKPELARPEVAIYMENRRLAMTMSHHKWQDRKGELTPSDADRWAWVRLNVNSEKYTLSNDSKRKSNRYTLHLGSDITQYVLENGSRLDFGVMGLIGIADSKTTRRLKTVKGDLESYNLGGYMTWQQDPTSHLGAYIDTWAMYGWNKSTVKGAGLSDEKVRSHVWNISAEMGYAFQLNDSSDTQIYLQPQGQVIWTNYRAKSHLENTNTLVDNMNQKDFYYRLGARLYADVVSHSGKKYQPFVDINYWGGPSSQTMSFGHDHIKENLPGKGKSFEVALGVQGQLSKNINGWARVSSAFGSQKYRDTAVNAGISISF